MFSVSEIMRGGDVYILNVYMRQKLVFDKKKTRFPEPSVRKISYNIGI